MAIDNPPAFLQAGAYAASRDRLNLISARFLPTFANTTDVAARSGILPGQSGRQGNFSMTGWDVNVGRFIAVVENTFASQAGDYQVLNTATQTLTVTASSPTTNRIDVIGVRVQDAFYSGALNQADLVVVQGTPVAGSPAAPTLPASFMPIVQVTVNANTTTGILTDLRKRTNPSGAAYQPFTPQLTDVGSSIGEVQLLPAAAPYPARLRVWDGSVWRGVTPYAFATPAQTGSGIVGTTSDLVLASLSVPDPGFQYKILSGAMADWQLQSANVTSVPCRLLITVDAATFAAATGNALLAYSFMRSAAIGTLVSQGNVVAVGRPSVAQSGSHTVRAIINNGSGSTTINIPPASATQPLYNFSVEIVPA